MIVAAAIRNLDDRSISPAAPARNRNPRPRGPLPVHRHGPLTLRLWELAHLALPLIVILAAQVALCWPMCVTMVTGAWAGIMNRR